MPLAFLDNSKNSKEKKWSNKENSKDYVKYHYRSGRLYKNPEELGEKIRTDRKKPNK